MAAAVVVTCPECKKKFKPKTDVRGKKIKCPFCKEPFVVPGGKDANPDKPEADQETAVQAKPGEVKPAEAAVDKSEYEADPNPYGVTNVELVPRCPNCTTEMGPHDIICLECGYNTLTRQWGKTTKVAGLTWGRHLKYLAAPLAAAFFSLCCLIDTIWFTTVLPFTVGEEGWMASGNSEASRMWTTVIRLGWLWSAGIYLFKKFIEKPRPDDIVLD